MKIFDKFKFGLSKSSKNFSSGLNNLIFKRKIDKNMLIELEDFLIQSDVGIETAKELVDKFTNTKINPEKNSKEEIFRIFSSNIFEILKPFEKDIEKINQNKPSVILIAGVNGVGKTTTIGKLGKILKKNDKKVIFGAADTFRAAAVDQLVIWSERVGVDIVKQDMGSDPASVAFDTLQSAKANNAAVVIIDTAGRLHNNVNLMRELGKIRNVMQKVIPNTPHDVMLVLDASTGQNAIEQATQFTAATEVNSIALTKLDGTAKGGVVIGISDQFQIPVRYIGVGEGMEDLQQFNKTEFVDSLFN